MALLQKLLGLTWTEGRLLAEAALSLSIARLTVLTAGQRRLVRRWGRPMTESSEDLDPRLQPVLKRVAWAVDVTTRRAPWKSQCLVEAMAAQRMLHRRGIPSTLYLGVAKEPGQTLASHAWLRSGAIVIVGGRGRHRYRVISTFSDC